MSAPIHTFYAQGPGPKDHDWEATRSAYEEGDPVGHGETERDAILDLLEREAEAPTMSEYAIAELKKPDSPLSKAVGGIEAGGKIEFPKLEREAERE